MTRITITALTKDSDNDPVSYSYDLEQTNVDSDTVILICLGLLYEAEWIPGSLHSPQITVNGNHIYLDDSFTL